jgi:hypothetical protein
MKRFSFSLSKPKRIILLLLLINVIAFTATRSMADRYSPAHLGQNEDKKPNYIEKGWQIVNWSYNLLKYFKKPQTDIPG